MHIQYRYRYAIDRKHEVLVVLIEKVMDFVKGVKSFPINFGLTVSGSKRNLIVLCVVLPIIVQRSIICQDPFYCTYGSSSREQSLWPCHRKLPMIPYSSRVDESQPLRFDAKASKLRLQSLLALLARIECVSVGSGCCLFGRQLRRNLDCHASFHNTGCTRSVCPWFIFILLFHTIHRSLFIERRPVNPSNRLSSSLPRNQTPRWKRKDPFFADWRPKSQDTWMNSGTRLFGK